MAKTFLQLVPWNKLRRVSGPLLWLHGRRSESFWRVFISNIYLKFSFSEDTYCMSFGLSTIGANNGVIQIKFGSYPDLITIDDNTFGWWFTIQFQIFDHLENNQVMPVMFITTMNMLARTFQYGYTSLYTFYMLKSIIVPHVYPYKHLWIVFIIRTCIYHNIKLKKKDVSTVEFEKNYKCLAQNIFREKERDLAWSYVKNPYSF